MKYTDRWSLSLGERLVKPACVVVLLPKRALSNRVEYDFETWTTESISNESNQEFAASARRCVAFLISETLGLLELRINLTINQ